MSTAFHHTLHALNQEQRLSENAGLVFLLVLFVLAGSWLLAGRVTLYETGSSAWLEAHQGRIDIDAPVAGQVEKTYPSLGQDLRQGEPGSSCRAAHCNWRSLPNRPSWIA